MAASDCYLSDDALDALDYLLECEGQRAGLSAICVGSGLLCEELHGALAELREADLIRAAGARTPDSIPELCWISDLQAARELRERELPPPPPPGPRLRASALATSRVA